MRTWTKRDGTIMAIKDMTDAHIDNCIKILERTLTNKPEYQAYCGNGEMAEITVDNENYHNDNLEEKLKVRIEVLQKELKNRKI